MKWNFPKIDRTPKKSKWFAWYPVRVPTKGRKSE